jgi:tetratricopeptide (TPR) repeat protein
MENPAGSKSPLSDAAERTAGASAGAAPARSDSNQIDAGLFWAIAVATIAILAFPLGSYFLSRADGNLLRTSAQMYEAKQYQQAIDAARSYLKQNPASSNAYNNIAISYLGLGQYDDAVRNAMEALRLDSNNELAKRNLNWIASERAKGGRTIQISQPPSAEAERLLNLSLQQYNEKKFSECAGSAKAALTAHPHYAEAYNNLAACEIELKHYDAAVAAAQEAIRLKPDFQLARNNLAWALQVRDGK